MRKVFHIFISISLFSCFSCAQTDVVVRKNALSQSGLNSEKNKKELELRRQELEGSRWDIVVKTSSGQDQFSDRLIFEDKKFSSETFSSNGFVPVQYSLSMNNDGIVVFETMQAGKNGGVLFWKAEFGKDGDTLKGILSQVFEDQAGQDLYFSGRKSAENITEAIE